MPLAMCAVKLSVVLGEGRFIIYGGELHDLAFDDARDGNKDTVDTWWLLRVL